MTTNILSIGTAAPSKQSLLGSTEISAEGNVIPQDADPAETPFLPMFLQMLFVQSQIKPVPEETAGELAVAAEAAENGTSENSVDVQAPVSILAGSIDGLTRLTMERTQPAMDALRSQLAQIQRPREGEDASMILPSLFGKNMRMPVANVQEVIRAVSHGFDPQNLGTANDLVAKEHSSITLDAEEVKKQTARELISSLMQTGEDIPVDRTDRSIPNTLPVQITSLNGHIELDTEQTQGTSVLQMKEPAVPQKNGSETSAEPEQRGRTLHAVVDDGRRTEDRQNPSGGRTASLTALNEIVDETVTVVSAKVSQQIPSAAIPLMTQSASGERNEDPMPQGPAPEVAAASVRPKHTDVRTEKSEKKSRPSRSFNEAASLTEKLPIGTEETTVIAPESSELEMEKRSTDDGQTIMMEKPQQPVKQDAQEFRRAIAEAEPGALKAPSGLTEVRKPDHIPAEAIKSETVRSMMEQLSKGVAVAVNENRSEMKLILHPEALGEVTVRVQVEEGKVTAKLDVQQVQTKNTIEANIPQLREALTSRGLTMERIEISTAQNSLADGTSKQQQNRSGKRSKNGFERVEEEEDVVKMYGYNTVEYTV